MPETAIPEDVRTLLFEHIHTHEQLEALLLMHADPTRDWNVQQLADTLKIARGLAEEAVGQLAGAGVIEVKLAAQEEQYRGPRADFRPLVERLSQVYEQNRFEVIMLMSANAIERVRTGALRAFADAFVIRRKG